MPKIARFGRALVELNHQITNSRKRAARNHEESRVFTQPLRTAVITPGSYFPAMNTPAKIAHRVLEGIFDVCCYDES
jgi:hypothetical protein